MSPQEFNIMLYKDYLLSDYWKELRKKRLSCTKYNKCRVCGTTKHLQIHHRVYRFRNGKSVLGKENNGIFRTLCKDCHQSYHKYFGIFKTKDRYLDKAKFLILSGKSRDEAFYLSAKKYCKLLTP